MKYHLVVAAFIGLVHYAPGQNVGIGTSTPGSGLELKGNSLGAQQRITDAISGNSLVLQGGVGMNLKVTGYNYNTATAQPLYLSVDGANTFINVGGGQVGIGTNVPVGGYLLNVAGPVKSTGNSTQFVAETNGGTNSWARYYLRSTSQSWFIGTSQNFNGNQLYIADETFNQTRFTIQPNGGPFFMQGNITQNAVGYGMPKAMVYLNANGTINRCYNGVSGASNGGCGFTSVKASTGDYRISFPFDISSRFVSVSIESGVFVYGASCNYKIWSANELGVAVSARDTYTFAFVEYAMPIMVIVY
jgi:hypothetical protein